MYSAQKSDFNQSAFKLWCCTEKNKFDFLAKIMTFEANCKFLNETTADSMLFGHVGSV